MGQFATRALARRLLTAGALAALLSACTASPPPASAVRIESREQLIGGKRALGEVGDFRISNGIIQAVVQDVGHSRGFGVFGGSLIDVDFVRGGRRSASTGGSGNDQFNEMFPAFFLQAIEPQSVEVAADGRDGKEAIIRVRGEGGDFLSTTKEINRLVLGSSALKYEVDYILEPGKSYLKMMVTLRNGDSKPALFPFEVPFGFVSMLGDGQELFLQGSAGFDVRNRMEEVYKKPAALNALPGEVVGMIATEGDGISYALAADPKGAGYLQGKPQYYPKAERDSILVPVATGMYLATFWGQPPSQLEPGASFSYSGYLAVGTGDIASAQNVIYGLKEKKVGRLVGRVREEGSLMALPGALVVAQDTEGRYISSARTAKDGSYWMPVPPAKYRVFAVEDARRPRASASDLADYVSVAEGEFAEVNLDLERAAILSVSVKGEDGAPIPAKISVEGAEPYSGLFNLAVGDRFRPSDFVPDVAGEPDTQKYLERVFFAPDGSAGRPIRPGVYTVHASRGIEYDLASARVELKPGQEKRIALVLKQVMPTPDYVSADLHVHSVMSVDSNMPLRERVASYAAEGVDFIASTEHNFVADYAPTVDALGLTRWLKSSVGLELTTLEMGHFNAYPLKLEPGPVRHGAFDWFLRPPGEIFARLRGLGKAGPDKVLIQVNHPRTGYFSAFNWGSYLGAPLPISGTLSLDQAPLPNGQPSPYHPSNFSLDFDVLEVFNGKHFEQVHHYRVPATTPDGPEPSEPIPAVGEVLEKVVQLPQSASQSCPPDCRAQPQPVYPGVLDDFYTLTAMGQKVTAVGNSDSHGAKDEAGVPRTYVWVGEAAQHSMQALSEDAVMEGLRQHRAIITNGPFVEVWVNEQSIGSQVLAPDGVVKVKVRVQAAPWVDVSEVLIKRGGSGQGKEPSVLRRVGSEALSEGVERWVHEETFTLPDDSFVVVEVLGEKSLWPVFTPLEVPAVELADAVGSLGDVFGLGSKYGRYRPVRTQQVKPFAVTNPIWVSRTAKQGLTRRKSSLPLGPSLGQRGRVGVGDLRVLFDSLHAH